MKRKAAQRVVTDPVCRMEFPARAAAATLKFNDRTYLFSVQPGKVPSASGKEPENRIRLPIDKRRRVNYIGRDGRPE